MSEDKKENKGEDAQKKEESKKQEEVKPLSPVQVLQQNCKLLRKATSEAEPRFVIRALRKLTLIRWRLFF
jgi:hypothetical protein